jgi:hypothetical protein
MRPTIINDVNDTMSGAVNNTSIHTSKIWIRASILTSPARQLMGSPNTSSELANRQQPATPHPSEPYPTSRHSRGHINLTQSIRGAPDSASAMHHTIAAGRSVAIARVRAAAPPPPPRELGGPVNGHRRRGHCSGGRRGRRVADQAAGEPKASCAQGSPHTGV